ncbi:hypothetical protein AB0L85_32050 [Streptomyces sp. NPDC052051]|uniref:hypothetical protein n=1 Tax=Streptomyces sp. NPDC052051 TaxID=3154649 RepID=UPI003423603B
MEQSTDRSPSLAQDVTDEHRSKAARLLADVARTLAIEDPTGLVDPFRFAALVGSRAYEQAGRSCHGDGQTVLRVALRAVGDIPAGVTREEFSVQVAQTAGELGYDWSADDNQPAIPQRDVPGVRPSDELSEIPAPRPEPGAR